MSFGSSQQFCVRWNSHLGNLGLAFPQLLADQRFVDVTLACEGHQLHCHRLVLAACSKYFESLLGEYPTKHPIIILPRDIKLWEIQALVDFMYKGEVNVSQAGLADLLKCAEILQIRGLYGSEMAFNLNNLVNSQSSSPTAETNQGSSRNTPIASSTNPTTSAPPSSSNLNTRTTNSSSPVSLAAASSALLTLSSSAQATKSTTAQQSFRNLNTSTALNENSNSRTDNSNKSHVDKQSTMMNPQIAIKTEIGSESYSELADTTYENSSNMFGNIAKLTSTPNAFCETDIQDFVRYDETDNDSSLKRLDTDTSQYEEKYSALLTQDKKGTDPSISGHMQTDFRSLDNVSNRRVRRSEALLRQAAECVSQGQTFQTVSDMFNIPISTIRFFMARKGILPRRKRGRSDGSTIIARRVTSENISNISNSMITPDNNASNSNRSDATSDPPFQLTNYKLPDNDKPNLL